MVFRSFLFGMALSFPGDQYFSVLFLAVIVQQAIGGAFCGRHISVLSSFSTGRKILTAVAHAANLPIAMFFGTSAVHLLKDNYELFFMFDSSACASILGYSWARLMLLTKIRIVSRSKSYWYFSFIGGLFFFRALTYSIDQTFTGE